MYRSTLANTLQSQTSCFSPYVRDKLFQFMIAANFEIDTENFQQLKWDCISLLCSVKPDEWEYTYKMNRKKEEAMFQAVALQAQNLDINNMLDMIYSRQISKENSKQILQSFVKKLQRQALEKREMIINDAAERAQEIIKQAIEFKQMIIKKFASSIIEYKIKNQNKIINYANYNEDISLSKFKKDRIKKTESLSRQLQEINLLKYQVQSIKQKMEQIQRVPQGKKTKKYQHLRKKYEQ